jgi:ferritin
MTMKENVSTLINDQINHELYSAYLYLSMANYLAAKNLPGFAHWMKVQSAEEQEHAMKFYEYLLDRGEKVTLLAISAPPSEWQSPLDLAEHVLQHEQKVTSLINTIYAAALKENDFATQVMLHWFIKEQVEEEKNAAEIVANLQMIEAKGTAILMLDHQLGKRGGD